MAELQEILAMGQSQISTHLVAIETARVSSKDRRTGKEHLLLAFDRHDGNWLRSSACCDLRPRRFPKLARIGRRCACAFESARTTCAAISMSWPANSAANTSRDGPGKGLAEALLALMPPMVIADLGRGRGHLLSVAGTGGQSA